MLDTTNAFDGMTVYVTMKYQCLYETQATRHLLSYLQELARNFNTASSPNAPNKRLLQRSLDSLDFFIHR